MTPPRELLAQLGRRGHRLTPQRRMILEQVESAEGHISAEEIFQNIKQRYPSLNISTVYRTLELLKESGLVTETDMGDGRVRFHTFGKGHHHHLVCSVCGHVIDLDEEELEPLNSLLNDKYGFLADLHHLAIFGRCRNCR